MSVLNRLKQVATVSTVALFMSITAMNQATAAERYIVSGVESWDTLNIRSEPNSKSAIIGEIPSNGSGVNSNGEEVQSGRSTWIKVNWNGVSGWVSKRYLATDYSYNAPSAPAVQTPVQTTVYTQTTNYVDQNSQRDGSIYAAGNSSVRSVYAGPGNGLPQITTKQNQAPQSVSNTNTANTHTHPANRCTRSVSHTHPNGANRHTHRYSCQGQATQPQVQQTQTDANTHTHPRNQFTNAVTHTHASGSVQHKHNYGGQGQAAAAVQQQVVDTGTQQVTHIHPASPYNKRTQHTHPGGAGVHIHNFLMPHRQAAAAPATQVSADTHTHPKNNLTNSVSHTHPNGANQHSHSYGGQR